MNTRELLYPYVVPSSWTDYAGKDSLLSWEISDDVHVVLVFDGQGTVRNVRPQDLESLQLDEAAAFDAAALNLARAWEREEFSLGSATLLDGIQIGCARGNWMAPAGGLLLGNFHAALSQQFGCTSFVAVAVNQECLFAFPTDERTLASDSLRLAIDDEFKGHRKSVSRQWLLIDGQWPQKYPGKQIF
jgi:hypothetical protein